MHIFLLNILKLNGQPFFKTSLTLGPSISIIALECERSVTAKSLSLKFFKISLKNSFLLDGDDYETSSILLPPRNFNALLCLSQGWIFYYK